MIRKQLLKSAVFLQIVLLSGLVAATEESNDLTSNASSMATKEEHAETALYILTDINGRVERLKNNLKSQGIIDESEGWGLGKGQLILLGNLTSPERKVEDTLSFVKALQEQAHSAGGQLKVVLGEKDVKLLLSEVFFRESSLEASELKNSLDWLSTQDFILQIKNQVFSNGGLSARMKKRTISEANDKLKNSLATYHARWSAILEKNSVLRNLPFESREDAVKKLSDSQEKSQFLKSSKLILFSDFWPHKYLGSSFCHPLIEEQHIDATLEGWNAERVWSASKMYPGQGIESRYQNRMLVLDNSHDENQPLFGAKITASGDYQLLIDGSQVEANVLPERHYNFPYNMSRSEIASFLKNARVISKEATKEGRTKPLKIRLEKDGKQLKAIYKFVNEKGRNKRQGVPKSGDRFAHEMAAYHLDQMLNINLVPIAVERVVSGHRGVVQLWVDNLVSALPLNTRELTYSGICNSKAQENMMNTFDYLVMNVDRNQSNITFTRSDWQMWFIDHTRAFGLGTRVPPFLRGVKIKPTEAFKERLRKLTREQVNQLETWLSGRQIEALWERRNILLESEFILE